MLDDRVESPDDQEPLWPGLIFYLVLCVALSAGPALLSVKVHPWAGVAAAVAAIPIWLLLGPRPGPWFLHGLIASAGFVGLLGLAVLALLRAVA